MMFANLGTRFQSLPRWRKTVVVMYVGLLSFACYEALVNDAYKFMVSMASMSYLVVFAMGGFYRENDVIRYVDVPLSLLNVTQDTLHFGEHDFNIHDIKKMVLEVVEEKAYLSLPYNPVSVGVTAQFSFPIQELYAVRSWLEHRLPHVKVLN
ncbi:hypothetical protein NI389_04305 [Pseudoalteromonas xiamenensis]|uniref:hypothetical protein n=1 Tax=Pseudoalteromonas xiamenensis TaxID=882626 RepID=UPI0027E4D4CA|nr:hypothetical protein [Pseudoalteromonas xiamenensis]WMN60636.1 hypothetical protein NI389_04305 [Pseudoalteromonas xiamenensis]